MPSRFSAFWSLFNPAGYGTHSVLVRGILAGLGVAAFAMVLGFYGRYALGMNDISDGFLFWTAMVLGVGVFSLTAASKKEKQNDDRQ